MRSSVLTALVIAMLGASTAADAQGTQQRAQRGQPQPARRAVATQPSNNPFQNPIGQGVPPAVSANPNLNNNNTGLTNPPR